MKIRTILIAVFILSMSSIQAFCQSNLPTLAVLNIDNPGSQLTPAQLASLTRIEVIKYGQFEVLDQYDIQYLFEKEEFNYENCYGKLCLLEAGKILGVNKVLSGSVEEFEKHVVVTLRQIDVASGSIEKAQVMEYLKIENQMDNMIDLTVQSMYGLDLDQNVLTKLTEDDAFESTINTPDADVLNLSGPRMGLTFVTGELAKAQSRSKTDGGFDALPVMSQFGYQFEIKYLNSGDVQALFEIIPVVTGLDQGRFIPSLTVLSGIRSNKTGLEFAFGPNIYMTQEANGFMQDGQFLLSSEVERPEGVEEISRVDSRGNVAVGSGIVLAVGKTFRSGNLNVPVNLFYIPGKRSQRIGLSFGFNINTKN